MLMPLEEMFMDSVNPGDLRFLTGCRALTHCCTLDASQVAFFGGAPFLKQSLTFIYNVVLDLLPQYLCDYF